MTNSLLGAGQPCRTAVVQQFGLQKQSRGLLGRAHLLNPAKVHEVLLYIWINRTHLHHAHFTLPFTPSTIPSFPTEAISQACLPLNTFRNALRLQVGLHSSFFLEQRDREMFELIEKHNKTNKGHHIELLPLEEIQVTQYWFRDWKNAMPTTGTWTCTLCRPTQPWRFDKLRALLKNECCARRSQKRTRVMRSNEGVPSVPLQESHPCLGTKRKKPSPLIATPRRVRRKCHAW